MGSLIPGRTRPAAHAAGAGCALAWWCGYGQGYRAAMAYRKVAAQVEAGTLPVVDTPEDDAA